MIVYDCLLFCNGNGQESSPIQSAPKAKGGVNPESTRSVSCQCVFPSCPSFVKMAFVRLWRPTKGDPTL